MKLALNILWFLFGGGIFAAALWIIAGGLLALTVVGLPFPWQPSASLGLPPFPLVGGWWTTS